MGLLQKFRQGLQKTQDKLAHEIKRIVSLSPKLSRGTLDELEAALIAADFGPAMASQIVAAVKRNFETRGSSGPDVFSIARDEVQRALAAADATLRKSDGLTVISIVGVNGTGKTTTAAKLAHFLEGRQQMAVLAACDTFRAAAVEQLKLWGDRLKIPVIAGAHHADPASVAHDAVTAALARQAHYLLLDTAGRLHTKHNLMQELQKLHRVVGKKLPGAPHEVLLVLDATTGLNALNQAREFNKAVPLSGLIVTKLDGTSKGGVIVAIQKELALPIKFIGLGEKPDDLQAFDAKQFAEAVFAE
jgi:fused signal recognition particle receptor